MPRPLVGRERILKGANTLARTYGLASISIRGVARECGVSTGTIYNYFPSRDELIAAVAAEFFSEAFYEDFCHPRVAENYLNYCERLYRALDERLSTTGADWLRQLQGLDPGAREAGRKRMEGLLSHIRDGLSSVLTDDPDVKRSVLEGDLAVTCICRFTLNWMFDALRRGDHECRTMLALLARALYQDGTGGRCSETEVSAS